MRPIPGWFARTVSPSFGWCCWSVVEPHSDIGRCQVDSHSDSKTVPASFQSWEARRCQFCGRFMRNLGNFCKFGKVLQAFMQVTSGNTVNLHCLNVNQPPKHPRSHLIMYQQWWSCQLLCEWNGNERTAVSNLARHTRHARQGGPGKSWEVQAPDIADLFGQCVQLVSDLLNFSLHCLQDTQVKVSVNSSETQHLTEQTSPLSLTRGSTGPSNRLHLTPQSKDVQSFQLDKVSVLSWHATAQFRAFALGESPSVATCVGVSFQGTSRYLTIYIKIYRDIIGISR